MSSITANAGKVVIAHIILTKNINVSNDPISAWNFNAEKDQVDTPTASVIAVNTTAAPVLAKVCSKKHQIRSLYTPTSLGKFI